MIPSFAFMTRSPWAWAGAYLMAASLAASWGISGPHSERRTTPTEPSAPRAAALDVRSVASVLVQTVGTRSLDHTVGEGFFRVTHLGGPACIERVVLDFAGSTNPAHSAAVFDTDQIGFAGCFLHGGSSGTGTYRNESDVTCGLVYDQLNTFVGEQASPVPGFLPPAANANCGFIASGVPTGRERFREFRALTFRFQPGQFTADETFAFDVDIDRARATGRGVAGLHVAVHLDTGLVLQGYLGIDPARTDRSFVVMD